MNTPNAAPRARQPSSFARFALAMLAAAACGAAQAGELGINVYGLSYHFDRDRAQALGVDNGVNPGLGFRYQFAEWERWRFFADAGAFRDSGRQIAAYGGVGALWQVAGGFQAGAALVVMGSDTYNDGRTFIAPLPLLAWDFGPVTLNATFFPKIARFNDIATLGFWVTLWPERW